MVQSLNRSNRPDGNRDDAASKNLVDDKADGPIWIVQEAESNRPIQLGDLLSARFFKRQSGLLVSFVLHLFLLFALSVVLVQVGSGRPLLVLEALIERPQQTEPLELDVGLSPSVDPFDLSGGFETLVSDDFESVLTNVAARRTIVQAKGHTSRKFEKGNGKSTEFFGTRIDGHSFVFVVDRSGSMQYGADRLSRKSQTQMSRFQVASAELMRAVGQLTEQQEFFVLLFSNGAVPMFDLPSAQPKPVKATEENKLKLERWLANVRVTGGTDPRDSLDLALKMQPDAIFMLSDGEFGGNVAGSADGSLEIVKNRNPGRVPIHTIALEDAASKTNMIEIAKATGGEFRFVTIFEHLQESSLGSLDPEIHVKAMHQLKTLGQVDWRSRYKFAKRVIKILENANPESQGLAIETLHWLSFDLHRGQPGWRPKQTGTDRNELETQKWRQVWEDADQVVYELRKPESASATVEKAPPETLALATFGDFIFQQSLSPVSRLVTTSKDDERTVRLKNSMQLFQDQFSSVDPFVLIYSTDAKQRKLAMDRILRMPISWQKRLEVVTVHLLPLLDAPDEPSRRFAEAALDQMSFELFQIPVNFNPLDAQVDPQRAASREWRRLWQSFKELASLTENPSLDESLSFEERIFFAYAMYLDDYDLNVLKSLATSQANLKKKILLARSLIGFQRQFGVTEECPEILALICNQLAKLSKREQRSMASVQSIDEYNNFLNNVLQERESTARRKYRVWTKLSAKSVRRPVIKKLLIEQYPETEYAKLVSQ